MNSVILKRFDAPDELRSFEARIKGLGLPLPGPPRPAGRFVPVVQNGASMLLEGFFGKSGKHARAAIGVAELPLRAPVELELIFEVQS